MALDNDALATVAEIKEYLSIEATVTSHDSLLETLSNEVTDAIEDHCRRKFEQTEYTEYFDGRGDGHTMLFVSNYPIDTGSTVAVYDDTDRSYGASNLLSSDNYAVYADEGIIELDGLHFNGGVKNIKVTYTGGLVDRANTVYPPGNLKLAAKKWVARVFGQRGKEHLSSENVASENVGISYDLSAIPAEVKKLLGPYRRPLIREP